MSTARLYTTSLKELLYSSLERKGFAGKDCELAWLILFDLLKQKEISSLDSNAILKLILSAPLPPATSKANIAQLSEWQLAARNLEQFAKTNSFSQREVLLQSYLLALARRGCSQATIKNYNSDIRQIYASSPQARFEELFTETRLIEFAKSQERIGLAPATIKRKLTTIAQFAKWQAQHGALEENQAEKLGKFALNFGAPIVTAPTPSSFQPITIPDELIQRHDRQSDLFIANEDQKNPAKISSSYRTVEQHAGTSKINERKNPISAEEKEVDEETQTPSENTIIKIKPFGTMLQMGLSTLALLVSVLGFGLFAQAQFFSDPTPSFAFPSTLTRPARTLSFQGRLTDVGTNPVTGSTAMTFRLFDTGPGLGGTELWSGTCNVDPDQDGIFATGLGDECGDEISDDVFSENSSVWLQVEVGSEVLTPRQSIKSVPYALNTETLQGYPASSSATANTVPVVNSSGEVVFAVPSGTSLRSTTGMSVSGTTLTLSTVGNGNITLDPGGLGETLVKSNLQVDGTATIGGLTANRLVSTTTGGALTTSISSANVALSISDETGSGLVVFNNGPTFATNSVTFSGITNDLTTPTNEHLSLVPAGTGNVGIGTSSPTQMLQVAGAIRLGTTSSTHNVLNTQSSGGAPSGNLFWGNRELVDTGNLSSFGVSSVYGTTNQISADNNTGTVTLSIPLDFRAPGSVNATTGLYTGASGGTRRIDSSGNLENIGTIATTGAITIGGDVVLSRGLANRLDLASSDNLNLVSGNVQVGGVSVITSGRLLLGANGTVGAPTFSFSSDTNTGMYSGGTDILRLATGGADRLTISADGNVGIGTTGPTNLFNVVGNQHMVKFKSTNNTTAGYAEGSFENDAGNMLTFGSIGSGYTTADWAGATYIYNTGSGRDMYIKSQDRIDLFTGGTALANRRVSILSNGLVGIGSTSPTQALDVVGNVKFSGALMPNNTAGTSGQFLISGGADNPPTWTNTVPATSLKWNALTNPDGNLTLSHSTNTTTFSSTATTGTFFTITANSLTTGTGLALTSSYASGNSTNGLLYVANTGAVTNGVIARIQSNSTAGSGLAVLANGNVGIGTTSPTHGNLHVVGTISATTGFRINNAAASGQYLRGNGTNFVSSAIQAADVPTLNQDTTGSSYYVRSIDTRAVNDEPDDFGALVKFDFKSNSTNGLSDGGTYNGVMTWRKYGNATDFSGGPALQLAYTDNANLWLRTSSSATAWNSWNKIWHGGNDGSGSGLDADLLDGISSASFVQTSRTLTLNGTTNQITVNPTGAQDLSTNRSWTLSLPQNIHTSATPQFARLGLGAAANGTYHLNLNGALLHGTSTGLGIGTTTPIDKLQIPSDNNPIGLGEFGGANLVFNGGAEDGMSGWTSRDFGVDASAGSGTVEAHSPLSGTNNFTTANDGGVNQAVILQPGATYTLSAKVRVHNINASGDASQGRLVVATTATGRNVADVACNPNTYDVTTNLNKWVLCSTTFTATNTNDVANVTMYVGVRAEGSSHTVDFDNIMLTRGGLVAGYTPISTYVGSNGSVGLTGNVGIGTTSPGAKLTLADHTTNVGGIRFRTAATAVDLWSSASNVLKTSASFEAGSYKIGTTEVINTSGVLSSDTVHGNRGGGSLHSAATTSANGFMSSTDKTKLDGIATGAQPGTVTSVGLSLPNIFSVTGTPVTTSGTLTATLANQNANMVFAGPSSGAAAAPTFRSLVDNDIPDTITLTNITQITNRAHSSLSGLGNDDHTQYALLAGRNGGQTLIGGTAANNVLTLQANSASTGNTLTNAGLSFKVGNSGGTTAMTILQNGNVGIGTTNLTTKLHVNGNFRTSYTDSSNSAAIGAFTWADISGGSKSSYQGLRNEIWMSGNAIVTNLYGYFGYITPGTTGTTTNSYHIYLTGGGTGNKYSLVTTSDAGNMGIKTTTPGYDLTVNGNINATSLRMGGHVLTPHSSADGFVIFNKWDAANTHFYFRKVPNRDSVSGYTDLMVINNSGGISMPQGGGTYNNSTGAWVNGSDRSFKTNIADLTKYDLSTINKIRPTQYTVISSGVPQIGFIAQELQPIIPELVSSSEDGKLGVNYGGLTVVLTRALQELDAKVDSKGEIVIEGVAEHPVVRNQTTDSLITITSASAKAVIGNLIAGIGTLANLTVAGTSTLADVTATGLTTLANATVTGATNLTNVTVTGASNLADVTVSGVSKLADLTVTGTSTLADVTTSSLSITADSLSIAGVTLREYIAGVVQDLQTQGLLGQGSVTSLPEGSVINQLEVSELTAGTATISGLQVGDVSAGSLSANSITTGDITATGSATLEGLVARSVNITDNLNVDGNTTLLGQLTIGDDTSISGTLSTETVQTQTLEASRSLLGEILAGTASVSGSITADNVVLGSTTEAGDPNQLVLDVNGSARMSALEAKVAEFEQVNAMTASLYSATISGSLTVGSIVDFDRLLTESVAPSLLQQLIGYDPQATKSGEIIAGITGIDINSIPVLDPSSLDELSVNPTLLGAHAGFFETYLQVNGNTALGGDIKVGGDLVMSGGISMRGNRVSISSVSSICTDPLLREQLSEEDELVCREEETLYISTPETGALNLMNGLVLLADGKVIIDGEVTFKKPVTIDSTLLTNLVTPTTFDRPIQFQVAGASTETGEVTQSRFEIVNELGTPVATISAQGKAEFAGEVNADSLALGSQDLSGQNPGENTQLTSSKKSGKAKITAGTSQLTIANPNVSAESLIYVTPQGSTGNQTIYVKEQLADDPNTPELNEARFTIGFDQPVNNDVIFNWWVVN